MTGHTRAKNKKMKTWVKLLMVVVSMLLAFCIVFAVFYITKLNKINFDDGKRPIDTDVSFSSDDIDTQGMEVRQDGNATVPDGDVYHDDNVLNILLIGSDDRTTELSDNARADSIMVLSLNMKSHTIKLVSFERAIGVPVPGMKDDWLTHTFRYGGADLTMSTIRNCFKLDVDKYIRVNFEVFKKIINKVGGVEIELTQAEIDYLKEVGIAGLTPGMNHLDNNATMGYVRARHLDSDWSRVERQRKVIDALIQKGKTLNVVELNSLCDVVLPMVQTNLTKTEITSLLLKVPGFKGAQTQQMTMPDRKSVWIYTGLGGRHLYGVDFATNSETLKNFLYE